MAASAGLRPYLLFQLAFARFRRCASIAVLLMTGGLLAGCVTDGTTAFSNTSMRGATIAFESIDGLPQAQFNKLVRSLTEEATSRQISVVSRESQAQFRARGYAAAHMRGKRTVIAWVWDIYDSGEQRVLRISGEEQASGNQRGWGAADDPALRRIASESMTQLAGFMANPGATPPTLPPSREPPGVAVANSDPNAGQPAPRPSGYAALATANTR